MEEQETVDQDTSTMLSYLYSGYSVSVTHSQSHTVKVSAMRMLRIVIRVLLVYFKSLLVRGVRTVVRGRGQTGTMDT